MQLTTREKALVLGGTGVLVLLMAVQFVVRPTMDHISTLRRVVTDKREVLAQMEAKSVECQKLQAEVVRLESTIAQQQEGKRILSTIESIRRASGLPENVLFLKPTTVPVNADYQQTVVEIRLENIALAQLIAFLSQVDALNLAGGVKSLDIRTAERGSGSLRAVIQLATVTSTASVHRGI